MSSLLHELRAERGPLIMAHRGTAVGSIAENTPEAVRAARVSGADLVEIDVSASADGEFFAFHDGAESRLLGEDIDILSLDAAQIRQRRYVHVDRAEKPATVATLTEVLEALPAETPVNIDRSWPWWDTFLPWLDDWDGKAHLVLKCPASEEHALQLLRAHPHRYPFLPICRDLTQAEALVTDPALNTVGVELLAETPDHPALDPLRLRGLRAAPPNGREPLVLVNSEVLTDGVPLFAGHDDERAVLASPESAWRMLFELGVDIIQTDWPWVLHAYREKVRQEETNES